MPNAPVPAVLDEPPQLSEDMTRADLVDVLQHLPWRGGCSCTVKLDRGVSAYLIRLLKQTKSVGN